MIVSWFHTKQNVGQVARICEKRGHFLYKVIHRGRCRRVGKQEAVVLFAGNDKPSRVPIAELVFHDDGDVNKKYDPFRAQMVR